MEVRREHLARVLKEKEEGWHCEFADRLDSVSTTAYHGVMV